MEEKVLNSIGEKHENNLIFRWAIGFDHAGFELAQHLTQYLLKAKHKLIQYGPTSNLISIDYVPFSIAAAKAVVDGIVDFGIVIGGSGQGEQIAANKVRGVRAALCNDIYFAKLARRDNNANVIALASRVVAKEYAETIIDVWLNTSFEGGRHERRINLIDAYEANRLSLPEARIIY